MVLRWDCLPSELFALLSRLIAIDSSVGCGDSITLEETGIFDFLRTEIILS